MKKSLIIGVFLLLNLSAVRSQLIAIPWQCGFEDSLENMNWKFANPVDPSPMDTFLVDAWAIGRGARSLGRQSMYISVDSGKTATFGSSAEPKLMLKRQKLRSCNGCQKGLSWKSRKKRQK